MKRFSALGATALLFTACTQTALPSEEVFNRATDAIRTFASATFVVHATSVTEDATDWSVDASGQMASGGKQLQFSIELSMGSDAGFEGNIVIPAEQEVYLKADRLSLGGSSIAPMLGMLEGTWWKLPSGTGADTALPLTPDPSLLSMQMETLQITKEYGIVRINQRNAYKYDVTMDKAKLLAYLQKVEQDRGGEFNQAEWQSYLDANDINGTIWIDADHFLPDRLQWTVQSKPVANPRSTLTFDVTFTQHNENISITPPETSAPLPVTATDLQDMLLPPTPTLP